ncbi:unnamed protein product [Dicrocoelium dendriticum]|nr:unnamed protein product [Dicrocoelium dendriticum]
MAPLAPTVLTLVVFLFPSSSASEYSAYLKKDFSVSPEQTDGWSFYGKTVVDSPYIRLTRELPGQVGGMHSVVPVTFRDWEVRISFHVHGAEKNLFGDGFAFWYTESPSLYGKAFGSHEVFRGLGIFFDTYANRKEHPRDHPYVSAMISNGKVAYNHDEDGADTELKGCSSDFRNQEHAVATIRYVKNELSVSLEYPDKSETLVCFKVEDVLLPVGYYFGVSAATGDLFDNHDIYSIRTYEVAADRSPEELSVDASRIEPSAGVGSSPRGKCCCSVRFITTLHLAV